MKYLLTLRVTAAFVFVSLFWAGETMAQQEIQISHYMFNGLFLNPAYAGSHNYASATVLHRSQWVGIDGAPTTQLLGFDMPIINENFGIGLNMTNESIGIIQQTEVAANFSYKLKMSVGSLRLGLRGGVGLYSADYGDVVNQDKDQDPLYQQGSPQSELIPKFGGGIYYSTEKMFVGLSVPLFFAADESLSYDQTLDTDYFESHFYLYGGYVFEINRNLAFKPSALIKYEDAAPIEGDINLNVLFYKKLWLGAGYRTGDAIVAMLEYNFTPQLRLGYSYDYNTSLLNDFNGGSHEVMLGYDFGRAKEIKVKSPRYF